MQRRVSIAPPPLSRPRLSTHCGNRDVYIIFPGLWRKIATLAQPAGVIGMLGRERTLRNPSFSSFKGWASEIVRLCMEIRIPPAPIVHTHANVHTRSIAHTMIQIRARNFKRQSCEKETEIGWIAAKPQVQLESGTAKIFFSIGRKGPDIMTGIHIYTYIAYEKFKVALSKPPRYKSVMCMYKANLFAKIEFGYYLINSNIIVAIWIWCF